MERKLVLCPLLSAQKVMYPRTLVVTNMVSAQLTKSHSSRIVTGVDPSVAKDLPYLLTGAWCLPGFCLCGKCGPGSCPCLFLYYLCMVLDMSVCVQYYQQSCGLSGCQGFIFTASLKQPGSYPHLASADFQAANCPRLCSQVSSGSRGCWYDMRPRIWHCRLPLAPCPKSIV